MSIEDAVILDIDGSRLNDSFRSTLLSRMLSPGKQCVLPSALLSMTRVACIGNISTASAKLLADTAPEWDELQVAGRMAAAAAIQCTAMYPPDQEEKLSHAPVHFIGMWRTHGELVFAAQDNDMTWTVTNSLSRREHPAVQGPPQVQLRSELRQHDLPRRPG
jgi:hypothetical protein